MGSNAVQAQRTTSDDFGSFQEGEDTVACTYKFIVDCRGGHCDVIRKHMKQMGFRVGKNHTSLGDHYGLKEYPSMQVAHQSAQEIVDECSPKIRQIAVFPDEE